MQLSVLHVLPSVLPYERDWKRTFHIISSVQLYELVKEAGRLFCLPFSFENGCHNMYVHKTFMLRTHTLIWLNLFDEGFAKSSRSQGDNSMPSILPMKYLRAQASNEVFTTSQLSSFSQTPYEFEGANAEAHMVSWPLPLSLSRLTGGQFIEDGPQQEGGVGTGLAVASLQHGAVRKSTTSQLRCTISA